MVNWGPWILHHTWIFLFIYPVLFISPIHLLILRTFTNYLSIFKFISLQHMSQMRRGNNQEATGLFQLSSKVMKHCRHLGILIRSQVNHTELINSGTLCSSSLSKSVFGIIDINNSWNVLPLFLVHPSGVTYTTTHFTLGPISSPSSIGCHRLETDNTVANHPHMHSCSQHLFYCWKPYNFPP